MEENNRIDEDIYETFETFFGKVRSSLWKINEDNRKTTEIILESLEIDEDELKLLAYTYPSLSRQGTITLLQMKQPQKLMEDVVDETYHRLIEDGILIPENSGLSCRLSIQAANAIKRCGMLRKSSFLNLNEHTYLSAIAKTIEDIPTKYPESYLRQWLEDIYWFNRKLPFAHNLHDLINSYVQRCNLDTPELLAFLRLIVHTLKNNGEPLALGKKDKNAELSKRINDSLYMSNDLKPIDLKYSLNKLVGLGLVNAREEYVSSGDTAKCMEYRPSLSAVSKLLNGSDLKLRTTPLIKGASIICFSDIKPVSLHYNEDVNRHFDKACKELGRDTFSKLMSNMKENGYSEGLRYLLHGGPGTGKTEFVYQIARICNRDIIMVDVSQLQGSYVGESEKNYKRVMDDYAMAVHLCNTIPILLFNEADSFVHERLTHCNRSGDIAENNVQNIMLQAMERFSGILMMTTNLIDNLDSAYERRIDRKIKVSTPDEQTRISIWRDRLQKCPEITESNITYLATHFKMCGGDIDIVVKNYLIDKFTNASESGLDCLLDYCKSAFLKENPKPHPIGF